MMNLVGAVAAAYPLGPIRACERIDRIASSVARIETAERAYWLKLTTHTLDELESEAEIASELAQRGLQVTAPVRRCDGRYAGTIDVSPALLFDEAPGIEVEALSAAPAEALGALLARLHATAVPAADRRWRIDAEALAAAPLRAVEVWRRRAGRDAAWCAELARLAAEMIAIAWPNGTSLPLGLCHGDVQLENVRFDGARPTLFDLEACGIGPRAYDLACFWRKHIGLAPADPPHEAWDALLRGYEQVRALTPSERRAIPALAALRAIWVMAMPAAPGTTWGQDWLLDPEYIDAHVAMIERLARCARSASPSR
jgi:Ser/Thr protein kinase RdoA (MazF antagonist)